MIDVIKLFFDVTCVTILEFINTTRSIYELNDTCKEWVRFVRDIQFEQWIHISIFVLNGFFRNGTWRAQKHIIIRHVFKYNKSVIFWVYIFFHLTEFLIRKWIANLANSFWKTRKKGKILSFFYHLNNSKGINSGKRLPQGYFDEYICGDLLDEI